MKHENTQTLRRVGSRPGWAAKRRAAIIRAPAEIWTTWRGATSLLRCSRRGAGLGAAQLGAVQGLNGGWVGFRAGLAAAAAWQQLDSGIEVTMDQLMALLYMDSTCLAAEAVWSRLID